nr:RT0821/Lpp0805 family surface protein [Pararhizobium sp.]
MGAAMTCALCAVLSGCMSSGLDVAGSSSVDSTMATGSVPAGKSTDTISDELTVRNAVSSADIGKLGANPVPWANTNSGSAGVISSIEEKQQNGTLCRTFTTTRHSYQGIAKFDGNTCLLQNGEWHLMSFMPRDGGSPFTGE